MPRYKLVDRSPRLLPVIFDEQIQPGTFEFALDYLVDNELDLSGLHRKFKNDKTGAPAYDPAVMLKIVLLSYSRGLVSSRRIERACRQNVLFMAISGDSAPQFTTIARFVRELGEEMKELFTQVLMICDSQGLIGREMFAIDGVKMPSNASKHRSGTHAELAEQADRMEAMVSQMVREHREADITDSADEDGRRERRIDKLRQQAQRYREFLNQNLERRSTKGAVRKSNVTDNESAKMATSHGVIQGYTAVAAVDSAHQIIVGAMAHGSGNEQEALLPMIHATAPFRGEQTLITADAGFHSEANLKALHDSGTPAMIADKMMRRRDERFKGQEKHKRKPDPLHNKDQSKAPGQFRPSDFRYDAPTNSAVCPAGKHLYSNGKHCTVNGREHHKFTGAKRDCVPCDLRARCLRHPERTQVRQVAIFKKNQPSTHRFTGIMQRAIDSPLGRQLYGQRIGTVEPVFGNLRYNKGLDRFTLRGKRKVTIQWQLYSLVHNIEKLFKQGYAS